MADSIWVETEENDNCEWMPLQVYEAHENPRPVRHLRLEDPDHPFGIYEITGWSSEEGGSSCPAMYAPVSDSGQAVVHLVYGGDWGIRLRPEGSTDEWSVTNDSQHGEPYLMLIDGSDLIFE